MTMPADLTADFFALGDAVRVTTTAVAQFTSRVQAALGSLGGSIAPPPSATLGRGSVAAPGAVPPPGPLPRLPALTLPSGLQQPDPAAAAPASPTGPLGLMAQHLANISRLVQTISLNVAGILVNGGKSAPAAAAPPLLGGKPAAPSGGGGGGGLAQIAGIGESLATMNFGALAATAGLGGLAAAVKSFVGAFNPFVIEQLNVALENIQATIGAAFEPFFQMLLNVAQQANVILGPVFEQLKPVIQAIAQDVGERLLPVIRLLADVLTAIIPVFAIVNEAMRPLLAVIPALTNIMRLWVAVASGLAAQMGDVLSPLKGVTDGIVAAMKEATRAVILFAVNMAQMFGLTKVVDSIQRAFGPVKPGAEKNKTPGEVGTTDIASILRSATEAAYAQQGDPPMSVEEWLKGIREDIQKALARQDQFEANIKAIFQDLLKSVFNASILDIDSIRKNVDKLGSITNLSPADMIGAGGAAGAAVNAIGSAGIPLPLLRMLLSRLGR